MGAHSSQPLPVELPDFLSDRPPPNLPLDNGKAASTVPIHIRRRAEQAPAQIAVRPTRVARHIVHDLVPTLYPAAHLLLLLPDAVPLPPPPKRPRSAASTANASAQQPAPDVLNDWLPSRVEADRDAAVSVSIVDTSLNRVLLHHAMLGFTFQTAPFALRTVLESMPPPVANGTAAGGENRGSKYLERVKHAAAKLERSVLSLNMHVLSTMLCSPRAWAYTLALEPSPYFGYAGMEARVCFYGPNGRQLSFHVVGLMYPKKDIPKLCFALDALCPQARSRCLGVVAHLQQRDHDGAMGIMVSTVISHLYKRAPRKPAFFTPDKKAKGSRPPLMPLELAGESPDTLRKVVDEYRPKLELSWTAEDIDTIFAEHATLRDELGNWGKDDGTTGNRDVDGGNERKNSLAAFDKAWEFAAGRFAKLRSFVGALASAWFYTPKKRTFVSITGLESAGLDEVSSALGADLILQERQFEELRSFLGG